MKETELKLHPCYCGGEMEIKRVAQNGGMDGTYWNWELICKKCGVTRIYAADGFYGRKFMTLEEVINDWNRNKKKVDVLDKIRAEIEEQEKWLLQAGCNTYNVDIAFSSIKSILAESEET